MKTNKFAIAAIVAAALGTAALAQAPAAPAATPGVAAPNEIVYVPQLPSAAELTKAAAAQGVTITQIDQTSTQITVTYKYTNGYVNTVSYQPLSAADPSVAVAPASIQWDRLQRPRLSHQHAGARDHTEVGRRARCVPHTSQEAVLLDELRASQDGNEWHDQADAHSLHQSGHEHHNEENRREVPIAPRAQN